MPNWYLVFDMNAVAQVKPSKAGVYEIPAQFKPNIVFLDKDQALRHQSKLAADSAGHNILLLKGTEVVEAGVPPLIHKQINDAGEMIPR